MNKKVIIQLVIIIGGFAGAGYVLYRGFAGSGGGAPTGSLDPLAVLGTASSSGQSLEKVLPYGTTLDFKTVLDQQNLQYGVITYPAAPTSTEIGIPENTMVQAPPSAVTAPPPAKK